MKRRINLNKIVLVFAFLAPPMSLTVIRIKQANEEQILDLNFYRSH